MFLLRIHIKCLNFVIFNILGKCQKHLLRLYNLIFLDKICWLRYIYFFTAALLFNMIEK